MTFGANQVLHDVSMSIPHGAIFALLGENGAGKSTLMNLLGGVLSPVAGKILLDGTPVHFSTPKAAMQHGIGFIHQELSPVNDLMVYENVFLGREKRLGWLRLDRDGMRRDVRNILTQLQVDIDETAMMSSLDASQKQMVAIVKALLFKAQVLIMDEPTTSLSFHETERFFELVKKLSTENGVSVIFISHKLNEIKALCTDYAVLRNGCLVASGKISDVTVSSLSELIVGRELSSWERSAVPVESGAVVFKAHNLTWNRKFQNVSFEVHAGEILGFTGLLGGGHKEVFQCIFGDVRACKGELFLDGKPFYAKNPAKAMSAGVAYVPGNRKENAILPDMNVLENGTLAMLSSLSSMGIIRGDMQKTAFYENVGPFRLKCDNPYASISSLSGGNQQKVILARCLSTKPKILILDNPTQGVDIGAKQEIYESIRKIASAGAAVIVISGEGQEIQRVCHRAIVMSHGNIVGELCGEDLREESLMKLAMEAV